MSALRFDRREFAVSIEELPDDAPLMEAMERLAEQDGEKNND